MNNPLLADFNTPFSNVPFEDIKEEHFLPALKEAIAMGLAEVESICIQEEAPTFKNTILALELVGEKVSKVAEVFFNLNSAETNDTIQSIAREFSPLLSSYRNDIMLNEALFARVAKVWEQDQANFTGEDLILLEKSYKSFARNGIKLKGEDKQALRGIDEELSSLSLKFGENVLAETNAFELFQKADDLAGLPDYALASAAEEAKAKGREGEYLITLQAPSYIPIMTYAANRSLRESLFRAFGSKAFKGNEHDNKETVKRLVALRHKRAQLLGFKNHADYVLQERMAKSKHTVDAFLDELLDVSKSACADELKALQDFAKELDGIEQLEKWDVAYYSEKLKQKTFDIDDSMLKPYFQVDKVIDGAFAVAEKLYGISFQARSDIQKYHPDVISYEVKDKDGSHLALLYADFFPRSGKRNGAWMTSYQGQRNFDGLEKRPHISIVCNFTKPTADSPSLLTFNEVLTLFHEFGHALHGILADTKYESLSGTSVLWDFVELPSQIMENWCYEKECLDLFAKHYQTGELIPAKLIERLKKSATFMEGYATLRQVGFARLDMNWHGTEPSDLSVGDFEEMVFAETQLMPSQADTNMSCSFSHIFQGGYSAGYYSYKWAEVLDADAFELFKERGLFNSEVASAFRKLLSSGGAVDPAELYRQFRGQNPDPKALLRRAALIN
jgi:peptidyl-dipeptidase Dcp